MKRKKGWAVALLALFTGPFGYLYFGWRQFLVALFYAVPFSAGAVLPAAAYAWYTGLAHPGAHDPMVSTYGDDYIGLFLFGFSAFAAIGFVSIYLCCFAAYGFRAAGIHNRVLASSALPGRQGKKLPKNIAMLLSFVELFLLLGNALLIAAAPVVCFGMKPVALAVVCFVLLAGITLSGLLWAGLVLLIRNKTGVDFFPFRKRRQDPGGVRV